MLHLAQNIKWIRLLAGKNQEDFAKMVGHKCTKNIIYTYEKGIVDNPNQLYLSNIAKIANITLDQLYNEDLSKYDIQVINPDTKKMEYNLIRTDGKGHDKEDLKKENDELKKEIKKLTETVSKLTNLLSEKMLQKS